MLICPICRAPLLREPAVLRCASGHTFDLAREGYANLMAAKPGAEVGDSRPMLLARRAFLDRGHYHPLADLLMALALEHLDAPSDGAPLILLDAGCGEGYYTGRLYDALAERMTCGVRCYGLDVAKAAVRLAAKSYPCVCFVVADVWQPLPIATASIDLLLNVFAPRNPAEFARVVKPGGLLLAAIPGPRHLAELPILTMEDHKRERIVARLAPDFTLKETRTLDYEMALDSTDAHNLLAMTPHNRRVTTEPDLPPDTPVPMQVTASFAALALVRHAC
jgi:23S rRNA (guanine745-N1)-methyltransferase